MLKNNRYIGEFNEGNILYEYTVNQYLYPVVTESFEDDYDEDIIIRNDSMKRIKSLYDYIL